MGNAEVRRVVCSVAAKLGFCATKGSIGKHVFVRI